MLRTSKAPSISNPINYLSTLTMYRYGNSLVKFDREAERKLRLKIDLYIIPTVALLYLFCFIDRANIGTIIPTAADIKLTESC